MDCPGGTLNNVAISPHVALTCRAEQIDSPTMATRELNAENFQSSITDNDFVIVDFWAPWCGPCRSFAPTFEAMSEQHPEIVFAKVDTEAQTSIAAAFNIRSIPTLMVFRDQIIIYAEAGALSAGALGQVITQAQALDMNQVRSEIAAQGV